MSEVTGAHRELNFAGVGNERPPMPMERAMVRRPGAVAEPAIRRRALAATDAGERRVRFAPN